MPGALDFIRTSQNADGGWGYKSGGMSYVEPTAAVLLALTSQDQAADLNSRGIDYLVRLQHADGGWGIAALDDESGWMTAWAVWALARVKNAAAARGAEWLLRTEGIRVTTADEVARIKQILKIDPTLTGWPWQVGDGAWIFPTALALSALARSQLALAEERLRTAVPIALEIGGALLVDIYRILIDVLIAQDRLDDARELAVFAFRSVPEEDAYARAAGHLIEASIRTAETGSPRSRSARNAACAASSRARAASGYVIGGTPPFGHARPLPV